MILCMDTAHRFMGIALIDHDEVVDQITRDCFKKQAEALLPEVDAIMKRNGYQPEDIEKIVISKGPGSYTGVRIAMSVAKVLGAVAKIPVYSISTLRLYSAAQNGLVLMDARSKRAYVGIYTKEESFETVMSLEEIEKERTDKEIEVYGDGSLIGLEDNYIDIGTCFLNTRAYWKEEENIHALVPEYFKDEEGYIRGS